MPRGAALLLVLLVPATAPAARDFERGPVKDVGSMMILNGELDTLTPFSTAACGAYALLRGPRYVAELLRTGHCAFTIVCAPFFCGGGCEPGTLALDEAHALTMRYAVPFFLRYLAGKGKFRRELSAKGAPADVRIAGVCPGA